MRRHEIADEQIVSTERTQHEAQEAVVDDAQHAHEVVGPEPAARKRPVDHDGQDERDRTGEQRPECGFSAEPAPDRRPGVATPGEGGTRGLQGRVGAATAQRGLPAVVVSPPPTAARNVLQDGWDRMVCANASAMRAAPAASGCAGSERRTTRPNSAIEV